MSRRIILVCVAVGVALLGMSLVISGIARAADPPPMLNLKEPLSPPPVYSIDVTEGLALTLPVSNPLTSPAQVTVTAELVNIFEVTTGESAAGMFSLFLPVSQTVGASEVVTFTLSLKQPPSASGHYTGTLRLSTTGLGLSSPITTTQQFELYVLVSTTERGGQHMTPTLSLRLVGSDGELLSSPPVYRLLVSDEGGWQSTELGVHNLGSEEVTLVAGPLTLASESNEFVPATLGLLPISQTIPADEVVTFTLLLVEGWLPEGSYTGSLTLTAATEEATAQPQFKLLVTPWTAELQWAQQEFTYEADETHPQATIRVMARHADAKDIWLQLPALAATKASTVPFSTMGFLHIEPPSLPTLTQDEVTMFTLNFTTTQLPEPGIYKGALRLSASNAAPITKTITLVVPDRVPISLWESELDWAQDEFIYEADKAHTQDTVRVVARLDDAKDIRAELATLAASDNMTVPFKTTDFLSISAPLTLIRDIVGELTLTYTTTQLPKPGTYEGTLRLSASNAKPITKTLTLVVPDRAPISPWEAELEWAQEEFVYEADEAHTEATIQFIARHAGAKDIRAQLPTVAPRDALTVPFSTMDFLRIEPPLLPTLTQDKVTTLTLNFITSTLPTPGTYSGELRLIASNAAPITAPFTLVVPDTARGLYELVIAELGQSPPITTSATLTLTTALQFTGVRWLPAATSRADWWPMLAGALLFGVGLAALVGYTVWGLAGLAPKVVTQKTGIKGRLQKAWSWIRRHPKASLGLLAGTLVLVVVALSLSFDLTQADVGGRNLLIWEAQGRGPVREVAVLGGEVVNQVGDWGKIRIGEHDEKIEAGDAVTVPVTSIEDLSQPGVYQGRILIQSPDIAKGLVEVPVQVTVHDLIFWPALVILLGVVLGGWVKHLQDMVGGRLEQRKKLQEAWSQWNAHLDRDPYRETGGRINPLYTRIRTCINVTEQLLRLEPEWGIEAAREAVTNVGKDFKDYSTLVDKLTLLNEEMKSLDVSAAEATFQRAWPILDLFLAKIEELKQLLPASQKELEQLEEAVEAVPQSLSLELRDHVKSESNALEKELRNGELGEAQQRWHRAFELGLGVNLAALRQRMNTWAKGDKVRLERLKPAEDQLALVDEYLKKVTESPELYAEAWPPLIQAEAVFVAEKAERLADEVKGFMKAARELEDAKRDKRKPIPIEAIKLFAHVPMLLRGREVYAPEVLKALVSLPVSFPPERVEPAIAVQESEPYLWGDIENEQVTCKLHLQARGFDEAPTLKPESGPGKFEPSRLEEAEKGFDWAFEIEFTLQAEDWDGSPVTYVLEARCGDEQVVKKTITIRSPYTIELPLRKGDIVAGEWLFCEAIFQGPDPKEARKKHCYFKWEFNGSSLESKETPSGRFWVPFDYAGKSAHIQLRVLSGGNTLLQKALFEGRVQEPIIIGLYRDKRRHNFNRRLAALLLALVAGIGAKRVFGLTFGSFEEYLGAFAWGVGVSLGIDSAANGYQGLRDWVQTELLKVKAKTTQGSQSG